MKERALFIIKIIIISLSLANVYYILPKSFPLKSTASKLSQLSALAAVAGVRASLPPEVPMGWPLEAAAKLGASPGPTFPAIPLPPPEFTDRLRRAFAAPTGAVEPQPTGPSLPPPQILVEGGDMEGGVRGGAPEDFAKVAWRA